jgi:hypothetical protein
VATKLSLGGLANSLKSSISSPEFSWIALPSFVRAVDKSCTTSPQAYVPAHMLKHIKKVLESMSV